MSNIWRRPWKTEPMVKTTTNSIFHRAFRCSVWIIFILLCRRLRELASSQETKEAEQQLFGVVIQLPEAALKDVTDSEDDQYLLPVTSLFRLNKF